MTETATTEATASGPERVYRVNEVARHLDCDRNTIYRLIHDGRLRAVPLGRNYRVTQSAIADFLAGR
jgi:excisionase family DNA binding protein